MLISQRIGWKHEELTVGVGDRLVLTLPPGQTMDDFEREPDGSIIVAVVEFKRFS